MKRRCIEWEETKDGCWNCTSHISIYDNPMLTRDHQGQTVYQYIYDECFGDRVKGKVIRHKCNNRLCINPEHLELGTVRDNIHDMKKHGTWIAGETSPRHTLNWEQVKEIRANYKKGDGGWMGRKYGVSKEEIQNVVRRKVWTVDSYGKPIIEAGGEVPA